MIYASIVLPKTQNTTTELTWQCISGFDLLDFYIASPGHLVGNYLNCAEHRGAVLLVKGYSVSQKAGAGDSWKERWNCGRPFEKSDQLPPSTLTDKSYVLHGIPYDSLKTQFSKNYEP
jgi:hypothetical protein